MLEKRLSSKHFNRSDNKISWGKAGKKNMGKRRTMGKEVAEEDKRVTERGRVKLEIKMEKKGNHKGEVEFP